MNLFEIVKYGVSCRDAAERYGVEVNRYSMALCPFHNDRHPSLYVADDHYYCFACGEHGDVIDFAAKLFGLPLYAAAQRLAADFHLTPDKPPSAAALHAKCVQTEAPDERFIEACHNLDQTEYYLDILCTGDSYERAEVIQQQMADGELDRLRRRLEKIHKEEIEDGYDTADVA
ncbi:CHC2 zinc finger domain-containing protein [Pseudoflavonifractor sp. MSJ-37]|uniref:CHC2 zinc finger domain-containing protein n=1 Tax=Pseudoflavonifractor sp. MSJ-37 TaxID=2841531 RepID=UPI001C120783|nr:CHC2 zinc finger domain-containing protein [Pseudoflavonifractor sp. MSJ-37]MBU5434376.1 DNA primase [Pseudoflavonifractor sp. MSJ-37]